MILRKLISGLLYLVLISLLAFALSKQMPGDPAEMIANHGRENEAPPEIVEQVRREYGFDRGILEQYFFWARRLLLDGDLGYSYRSSTPVLSEIRNSLPQTLQLAGLTFLFTLLISFPLGFYSGISRSKFFDGIVQALSLLGYALPVFLVGNLLLWVFSVKLDLLPSIGHESWKHFILPVLTLSVHMIGWFTQIIRSSVKEAAGRYYILVARSKGMRRGKILLRYVLRPALLPIVTTLFILLGRLVTGSFIVEVIFAWNGIGRLLIESIMGRDFPMIQGLILYIGLILILINFLIDSSYLLIDPQTSSQLQGE